jgi:hypothetical protein
MKKSLFNFSFRSLLSLILMLMMVTSVLATAPLSPTYSQNLVGSFTTSGFTNPIELSDLTLKNSTNTSAVQTLNANEYYVVSFTVSDLDGLNGMSLRVVLYDDPDGDIVPSTLDGTTLTGDVFAFFWNQAGIASNEPQNETVVDWETADPGESWYIDSSNAQAGFANDSDPTTYNFVFKFRTSDIAVASSTWKLYVEVATNESTPDKDSLSLESSIGMNWYGQLVSQAYKDEEQHYLMPWGEVAHNATYANTKTATQFKYYSNGAFDTFVSAGESWSFCETGYTGCNHGTVTLSTDPTADKTFGIRINTSDYSIVDGTGGSVSGYKQVSTSWVTVESNIAKTSEAGVEKSYYFYLQLGTGFENGTYTGTVSMGISNHIDVVQ